MRASFRKYLESLNNILFSGGYKKDRLFFRVDLDPPFTYISGEISIFIYDQQYILVRLLHGDRRAGAKVKSKVKSHEPEAV